MNIGRGIKFNIKLSSTWRLDTLDSFSATLYKGDNFCDFLFAFLHQSPSEKKDLI